MKTMYEVWYKTEDGILTQVTSPEGLAEEWSDQVRARDAARSKVREDGIAEAWVVEKKAVAYLKK